MVEAAAVAEVAAVVDGAAVAAAVVVGALRPGQGSIGVCQCATPNLPTFYQQRYLREECTVCYFASGRIHTHDVTTQMIGGR